MAPFSKMTSTLIKQTGAFLKGISSGRWDTLYCLSCSTYDSTITYKYGRSCTYSISQHNQREWEAVEPTLQSAVYKPTLQSAVYKPTLQSAVYKPTLQSAVYNSKYLICLNDLTQTSRALYHRSPFNYSHQHELFISQHLCSSHSVTLYQKCSSHICNQYQQCRNFQTSTFWNKEESKVEKTVKALKDNSVPTHPDETTVAPVKKSLWQRFVGACQHYYHGFRLLAIDMKICSKLLWQLLRGKSLTRREHNQLVRTTADMFRLVPLLVFIIVPFAEFLLPFALFFFPNMLPSTFQDPKDEKEKRKKTLKAKLEMAKFLQKTINESAVQAKNHDGQTAESFALFMDKIRKEGSKPTTKDIMKFAKLFEDEITLDNLTRQQLRACCIILNITPIGSDALLRFMLQMKLRNLRADDKVIQKEGVESMSISELQAANRARGMRALGVSEERLREQMRQWLQLHLKEKIPTSLLLLSRALYLPENLSTEEKLGATITQLADTAADEAKVKVAEMSGEEVDNKTKFEIIKHEEEIIAAEKKQLAQEIKLLEEQRIRDLAEAARVAKEAQLNIVDKAKAIETSPNEILTDHAKVLQTSPSETLQQEEAVKITAKDLDDMECVLAEIAKERRLNIEQDALKGLKEEVSEYKEDLEVLKDVANGNAKQYQESTAARHLAKKVDHMIARLDTVMDDLQEEKSSIQKKISIQEKMSKEGQLSQEKIDKYKSNIISINELIDVLKRLKKVPSDSKLHLIFRVLDQDKDGIIDINDALRVLELLSQEHLKLSANQLDEVLNILKREAHLEEEERQKEKEEKNKNGRQKGKDVSL